MRSNHGQRFLESIDEFKDEMPQWFPWEIDVGYYASCREIEVFEFWRNFSWATFWYFKRTMKYWSSGSYGNEGIYPTRKIPRRCLSVSYNIDLDDPNMLRIYRICEVVNDAIGWMAMKSKRGCIRSQRTFTFHNHTTDIICRSSHVATNCKIENSPLMNWW